FLSSRRRHTRSKRDWSSDVCSSDLDHVIHPLSQANKIPVEKVSELHDQINKIIAEAIKLQGTTVHSFLNANGQVGGFQSKLQVYGHVGEPCPVCDTKFEKIKVNGRGTTFCPHCQVIYK